MFSEVHHRFGGGFDIRRQPDAVEAAGMMVRHYRPDPARLATAFGVRIRNQLNVVASDAVNRLIDGVDRTVAVRRFGLDLFTTGQLAEAVVSL